MTRTIMNQQRKSYDRTISIHLPVWMLQEYEGNFSEFARQAILEYLELMKPVYQKTPGFKVLTISLNESIQKDLNKIVLERREISRCEIVREAMKYKLLNMEIQKPKILYDPEKMIKVPNGDGTYVIKTLVRRLV